MLKDLRPGAASGGKTEREAAAATPPQDPQKTKTEAQSEFDFSALNEKQREYVLNTLSFEDLVYPTPDTVKSKNPSKRFRYVLCNDLWLAKNGFYYHLVPFILSVIFLALNLKYVNVGVNIGVACYLLLALLICKKIWLNKKKIALMRVIFIGLTILLFVIGAYLVERLLPQIYEKIYLPFSLKLFVLALAMIRFGKFFVYFIIMYRQDCSCDFGNVVKVKYGAPGCGKTSQSVQESLMLALQKWRNLQMQFYILHSREKDILRRNNPDELLDYYDVKLSYEFYINSPCIPCLWSNVMITDASGRRCHRLEKEHLQGLKRLPSHCVILTDEVGVMLKSDMSFNKAANYDLSDMFRLGRHFLNWSMICSEQDPNNIFIDARRVVGLNEGISGQTWICRPWLLEKIYGFLSFFKSDSFDKKIKREPKRAKFMAKFGGFISSIGFRLQPTVTIANTQTGIKGDAQDGNGSTVLRRQNRIIAATISDCYDERDYRRQYPSRYDREIAGDLAGSGTLGERVTGYGRQFVSTTPSLTEKRAAQDEFIKNLS